MGTHLERIDEESAARIFEAYHKTGMNESEVRLLARDVRKSSRTVERWRKALRLVQSCKVPGKLTDGKWAEIQGRPEELGDLKRSFVSRVAAMWEDWCLLQIPGGALRKTHHVDMLLSAKESLCHLSQMWTPHKIASSLDDLLKWGPVPSAGARRFYRLGDESFPPWIRVIEPSYYWLREHTKDTQIWTSVPSLHSRWKTLCSDLRVFHNAILTNARQEYGGHITNRFATVIVEEALRAYLPIEVPLVLETELLYDSEDDEATGHQMLRLGNTVIAKGRVLKAVLTAEYHSQIRSEVFSNPKFIELAATYESIRHGCREFHDKISDLTTAQILRGHCKACPISEAFKS